MAMRRHLLLLALGALASMGASFRTQNFVVEAPTPQIAQQIGQAAEHWRKEKAMDWLGQEMPPWPEPCPLRVKVTLSGAGGATSFAFDRGRVLGQHMNIEGPLERLLSSVLPHEVTHTVFAHYFRTPVPRWADEGGAVLSEDDIERNRHDMLCRQILNTPGRAIPLRRLFGFKEYPSDVMALYSQGYSVASYLVGLSNRSAFLAFVAHGMQHGWDSAAQTHYQHRSVEELEQAWLTHLRNTKRQPAQLAANTTPAGAELANRVIVRLTAPPAQPQLDAPVPVYRGQSGAPGQEIERFGDRPRPTANARPNYLPEPTPPPASRDGWQPSPPTVRLGPPQFGNPPSAAPATSSPVGYPH